MHRFGVGLRGDSGPKAPIVLGTKSFSLSEMILYSVFVDISNRALSILSCKNNVALLKTQLDDVWKELSLGTRQINLSGNDLEL